MVIFTYILVGLLLLSGMFAGYHTLQYVTKGRREFVEGNEVERHYQLAVQIAILMSIILVFMFATGIIERM